MRHRTPVSAYAWRLLIAAGVAAILLVSIAVRQGDPAQPAAAGPISPLTPTMSPGPGTASPSPTQTFTPTPTPTSTSGPVGTATPSGGSTWQGAVPPPAIDPGYPTSTNMPAVVVTGTKAAGTGIWINGAPAIPVSPATTWAYELALASGLNTFVFVARDGSGNESAPVTITITRGGETPLVTVDPPQSPTNRDKVLLTGSKTWNAELILNGEVREVIGDRWSFEIALAEGPNTITVAARDNGVESEPIVVAIVRDSIPPSAPTAVRSTPSRDSCTLAGIVEVSWTPSTDAGTGVVGYRYRWDAVADGGVEGGSTTSGPVLSERLGAGRWYLHVAAVDGAGNVSSVRDFGPVCLVARGGAIAGAVFEDIDGDGRHGNEPALAGWRLTVRTTDIEAETITIQNGTYSMEVPEGAIELCIRRPAQSRTEWKPGPGLEDGANGFCRPLDLAATPEQWLDLPVHREADVRGAAFSDGDGNGLDDRDDAGLPGITIEAVAGNGQRVFASTDADGRYVLPLPPGEYLFCATTPSALHQTTRGTDGACFAIAVRSGHDVAGPSFGFAAN